MATYPILVVDDELLRRLPDNFRSDPRYQTGAALELVPFEPERNKASVEETLRRWDSLKGISQSDFDPNAELEREKQRELAEEARWLKG